MEADGHNSQHLRGQTSICVPEHNSLCPVHNCYFQGSSRDDYSIHLHSHLIYKILLTLNAKAEQILTKILSVQDAPHNIYYGDEKR